MIIDARKSVSPKRFKPFTIKAAVDDFLDTIEVGGQKDVDALFAPDGNPVGIAPIRAIVSQLKGKRVFHVGTKYSNAGLATVRRIA